MTAFIPLDWTVGTNTGGRPQNQDTVIATPRNDPKWQDAILQKGVLMVVCDGVGGEAGGEVASRLAADAALGGYYNAPGADPRAWLEGAVKAAGGAVDAERKRNPRLQNMASTFVAAAVHQGMVYTAWVGDSRAYVVSGGGKIAPITADHSFVAEQVRNKVMTEQEAEMSTMKNYIMRSLGSAQNTTPDFNRQPLSEGDRVVLCSDGLHGVARDPQIADAVLRAKTSAEGVARLIQLAKDNKTGDNVSAGVLAYDAPKKPVSMLMFAGIAAVLLVGLAVMVILATGGNATQPQRPATSVITLAATAVGGTAAAGLPPGTGVVQPTSTLAAAAITATPTQRPTGEAPETSQPSVPKPTPQPRTNLVAPKLLLPAPGTKITVSDPPSFTWASAGTLAEDEYYVLAARHEGGEDDTWTKELGATLTGKNYLGFAGTRIQSWAVCVAKEANSRPKNVCSQGSPLVISEWRPVTWEIPPTSEPCITNCPGR